MVNISSRFSRSLSSADSFRYAYAWVFARGRRFWDLGRARRRRTRCTGSIAFEDLSAATSLAVTIGIPSMRIIGFLHTLIDSAVPIARSLDFPTMEQGSDQVLAVRPTFLLTKELSHDDLLRSPERFARSPRGLL